MEGYSKKYRNYVFLFYPVSFYIENAKGFRDYPEGFEPDIYLDVSNYYPGGDFGTMGDYLCNAAFGWIRTGQKPGRTSSSQRSISMEEIPNPVSTRLGGSRIVYRD
jgi:hypothetical protein